MNGQLQGMRRSAAAFRRAAASTAPRRGVLVLGSGKGGVGTSAIAGLVALAAADRGRRILLVDADENVGSLHLMLGAPEGPGPCALMRGAAPGDLAVPVTEALTLIPGGPPNGIADVPMSMAERRALFRRLSTLFDAFDAVVIDGGSRLDSVTAACGAGAARLVAVADPDRIALAATYALVKAAHMRCAGVPVDVVLNRCDAGEAATLYRLLRSAAEHFLRRPIEFAGSIPEDGAVRAAAAAGTLSDCISSGSAAMDAARRITSRILGLMEPEGVIERGIDAAG